MPPPMTIWRVPSKGTLKTLPAHELPEDALYDSENVLVRDGLLRTRPGLLRSAGSRWDTASGIPTGAVNYRNANNKSFIVVGASRGIYSFDGVIWARLTRQVSVLGNSPAFDGVLTASIDHPSRFTTLEIGGVVYLVHTNGVDEPMVWDGTAQAMRPLTGDPVGPESQPGDPKRPPKWIDIATIGDRVIGLVPPYTVRWGNNLALNLWPESNFKALAETTDPMVAVAPLGTLGGALYKRDSLWSVFAQGTSDESFYRFEFRGFYEGPASAAAVVNVSGQHFYMTPTGRIGQFNGSQHVWIADGIWPQVRLAMDSTKAKRTFGFYDTKFHEVWFFFVRREDTDGLPRGLVIISLPRPLAGDESLGSFMGSVSHLATMRIGGHTVTTASFQNPQTELFVKSTEGFDESGVIILGGPIWSFLLPHGVSYNGLTGSSFLNVNLPGLFPEVEPGTTVTQANRVEPLAVTAATPYRMEDLDPKVAVFPAGSALMIYNLSSEEEGCDETGVPKGEGMDAEAPFRFAWRTGLKGTMNLEDWRVDSVEALFKRGPNHGQMWMAPVRSYSLPVLGGEIGEPKLIDLENAKVKPEVGVDIRGAFHGLRFFYEPERASDQAPFVRYFGALVRGHKVAE